MVVVMEERATEAQIENVVKRLVEMGMDVHRSTGVTRTVLGAVGQGQADTGLIEMLEGVHEVVRISSPFKLASRSFRRETSVLRIGDVEIGGPAVVLMAGPCTIESEEQMVRTAAAVRWLGSSALLGGLFAALHLREWFSMIHEGWRPSTNPLGGSPLFGASFFGITGLHLLHVVGGVVVIAVVAIALRRGRLHAGHVETAGLYWHFVDLVWMFVFPLVYLMNAR